MGSCALIRIITLIQVDTENSTKVSFTSSEEKVYSVKLIKYSRKSDYTLEKLKSSVVFTKLESLLDEIKLSFDVQPLHVGYIEPGHGIKGRQRWLKTDDDLTEMYSVFTKKKEVILWCQCVCERAIKKPQAKKRTRNESDCNEPASTSKKTTIMNKILEVEVILKELQKKHGSLLSVEQFNAWAHMIHTKKHASYDVPPDLPYFRKNRKKDVESSTSSCKSSVGVSPGKRVTLRSECISQLDKWHDLYEKQCITQKQYDQLRDSILKDVFNF